MDFYNATPKFVDLSIFMKLYIIPAFLLQVVNATGRQASKYTLWEALSFKPPISRLQCNVRDSDALNGLGCRVSQLRLGDIKPVPIAKKSDGPIPII